MTEEWDREAWIKSYNEERPGRSEVELPTPEKEEAILVEAKKAIAEGTRYSDAAVLGWKAYDSTNKQCFYAHGFWIAEFLATKGIAQKPYRPHSSFVALDLEYEDGPGAVE